MFYLYFYTSFHIILTTFHDGIHVLKLICCTIDGFIFIREDLVTPSPSLFSHYQTASSLIRAPGTKIVYSKSLIVSATPFKNTSQPFYKL